MTPALRHSFDPTLQMHFWAADLAESDLPELKERFIESFSAPFPEPSVKAGRGAITFFQFRSGTEAALRGFRRGGLARTFSADRYVRLSTSLHALRPVRELNVLDLLYRGGVRVPRPLGAAAFFGRSTFLYRAALATERVSGQDLQALAFGLPAGALEHACWSAGREARAMLLRGVFHPDLHPANVLLGNDGEVMLIDFDRAVSAPAALLQRSSELVQRWGRAVTKRGLPLEMTTWFKAGLEHREDDC